MQKINLTIRQIQSINVVRVDGKRSSRKASRAIERRNNRSQTKHKNQLNLLAVP